MRTPLGTLPSVVHVDFHRIILAIETSNPSAWTPASPVKPGVAVGRVVDGKLEVLSGADIDPTRRDDELMQACDAAVRGAGLAPRTVTDVAVSVGPGGFTALRVAVTAAKMIADAVGARTIAIPSAQVVATRVKKDSQGFAVALASKTEDSYVTVFDPSGAVKSEGLCSAGRLGSLGVARLVADSFLPVMMREQAGALGIAIQPPVFDPRACLELAVSARAVDPLTLAPMYPREPEAVRKWRELGKPRG